MRCHCSITAPEPRNEEQRLALAARFPNRSSRRQSLCKAWQCARPEGRAYVRNGLRRWRFFGRHGARHQLLDLFAGTRNLLTKQIAVAAIVADRSIRPSRQGAKEDRGPPDDGLPRMGERESPPAAASRAWRTGSPSRRSSRRQRQSGISPAERIVNSGTTEVSQCSPIDMATRSASAPGLDSNRLDRKAPLDATTSASDLGVRLRIQSGLPARISVPGNHRHRVGQRHAGHRPRIAAAPGGHPVRVAAA
jgi:hypothetical protein